jgi:xylulokinase
MPVLGLDVGTQSLKAVVLGDDLAALGEHAIAYAYDVPRPGWAQQDPALWEAALAPAIAGALAAARLPPAAIAAIAVTGQLDGCVAVGPDGAALGPCLIWMDRRAVAELPALDAAAHRARTGVALDPGHFAAKARWLVRHARGLEGARFHQPVSFLVERLCGVAVFDPALASTTMLHDLAGGRLADDLCAAFDLAPERLPAIAPADAAAGRLTAAGAALTGLPAGVPVAVGTGDDFASLLGAGLAAPGRIAVVLGTAEVVGALAASPLVDPAGLVETHPYPAGGYLIENPGWLAGGALAWLAGLLGGAREADLDRLAEAIPPGADGVTFLPALSGAMAPVWDPAARGSIHGLAPSHGAGHLWRAALEGCAFAMRDVVDRLAALGAGGGRLLLIGGGAASDAWARIRADLTGLPVERAAHLDAAPVGAGLCAAVVAGLAPSLAAAVARLPPPVPTWSPTPRARPALDAAYARYRRLWDALGPLTRG